MRLFPDGRRFGAGGLMLEGILRLGLTLEQLETLRKELTPTVHRVLIMGWKFLSETLEAYFGMGAYYWNFTASQFKRWGNKYSQLNTSDMDHTLYNARFPFYCRQLFQALPMLPRKWPRCLRKAPGSKVM